MQFPRSSSEWSEAEAGGAALSPAAASAGTPLIGSSGHTEDLLARLSNVSAQYHAHTPPQPSRELLSPLQHAPPIHLDRINERSNQSSDSSGKAKQSSRNHKQQQQQHSPAPMVPPALDDGQAAQFNPLSAQRQAAQQAATTAAMVAAAKNDAVVVPIISPAAAAVRVPAPATEEGDEVEMAAVRSITGGVAGAGGGALGDQRREQQKPLLNGGGGGGGGKYSAFASDETQDSFLCGVIPRRMRREFWLPCACVVLMLAAAAIVAVVLYRNLHRKELESFTETLNASCQQRSKLLQQNFGFAVSSMQSMAGFFSVQQRYQANGTLFSESDWQLYVGQSNLPSFVDQFIFMPRVLDSERDGFEAQTGHAISELTCLNSTFRPSAAYDYAPRDQFFFVPEADLRLCFTTNNLTNPKGDNSDFQVHLSYTHVRHRFPFYFPYQYTYPKFRNLPKGIDNLYNFDAVVAFPLQGIHFASISQPIANGLLRMSGRQEDLVNKGQFGIGQKCTHTHTCTPRSVAISRRRVPCSRIDCCCPLLYSRHNPDHAARSQSVSHGQLDAGFRRESAVHDRHRGRLAAHDQCAAASRGRA